MNKRLPLPPAARWGSTLTAGIVTLGASYFWWQGVSIWLGVIFAIVAATIADMIWVARQIVPLLHIAIFIAALQYGLAPWVSTFYQSMYPEYQISDLPGYLAYAGPVLSAMVLGFLVSAIGLRVKSPELQGDRASPQLLGELDVLLWGGMAVGFFGSGFTGNLAFVGFLLATLRFVGAIGWMIAAAPGWKWRIGVLLLYEVTTASSSGMFHDLILWSLSLLAMYVFLHRVKRLVFVSVLAVLVFGVFCLQDTKWTLRAGIWEGEPIILFGKPISFSPWERPFVTGLCLVDSATKMFTGGYSDESIADAVTRFNQGWIIDRVMHHVPAEEPYARGETLWWALRAAVLPRVLAPDKLRSDGKINMERFAGHAMTGNTSMNLGFAGEMYANYGLEGGVIACGLYALLLGLFFRWAAVLAQKSPYWWAIAAFCGHWAFKAETDVGSVVNYVVKSVLLIFVIIWFMPSLRAELLGKGSQTDSRGRGRGARSRSQRARIQTPVLTPMKTASIAAPAQGPIGAAIIPIDNTGGACVARLSQSATCPRLPTS